MIDQHELQGIYDEVKTPYKQGVILRGPGGQMVDSPCVFAYAGRWYMAYVCMNEVGYETHLAASEDLLQWQPLGAILPFAEGGWDQWQASGGFALGDTCWGGSNELERYNGSYWMSYLGGALQGYETDPLAIGLATATDPTLAIPWQRYRANPVLTRDQPDVRDFERVTLYRSNIIRDSELTLGAPFVMFYNGKRASGFEEIGMALSHDMLHWQRHGAGPVVSHHDPERQGISGDPQVVKIGELWVMFYFGAYWKPGAFDTFACSRNLTDWTRWQGAHLVSSSEPYDNRYAHKPWLIKHKGVVYHYYCAVGESGRCIALATSRELGSA
jgi:predicted GH43/DUF377 family glycosyl hydrolase